MISEHLATIAVDAAARALFEQRKVVVTGLHGEWGAFEDLDYQQKNNMREAVLPYVWAALEAIDATSDFVVASIGTRHFDFEGVGRTEAEALDSLMSGWRAHCERTEGADPDQLAPDDANVAFLKLGHAYRDGEQISP